MPRRKQSITGAALQMLMPEEREVVQKFWRIEQNLKKQLQIERRRNLRKTFINCPQKLDFRAEK